MYSLFLGKGGDRRGRVYWVCYWPIWVGGSLGLSYIFEQRPIKLFLINGGYHTLQFSLMGLIIGVWP
ncbi:DUF1761 domain-containing protein (plasmid) [Pseudoalteromonas espejiana]